MHLNQTWPRRILKYSVLLSIKESYLFFKNWFGMVVHPFKTIRALVREQDFSQIILVFGVPGYICMGGLGSIWLARRWVGATPGIWGVPTKLGVAVVALFSFILFVYLSFWAWKVLKVYFEKKPKHTL